MNAATSVMDKEHKLVEMVVLTRKTNNLNSPFVLDVWSIIFLLDSQTEVKKRGSFPDSEMTRIFVLS